IVKHCVVNKQRSRWRIIALQQMFMIKPSIAKHCVVNKQRSRWRITALQQLLMIKSWLMVAVHLVVQDEKQFLQDYNVTLLQHINFYNMYAMWSSAIVKHCVVNKQGSRWRMTAQKQIVLKDLELTVHDIVYTLKLYSF
ncbi:hypothetical protein CDAR_453881, partial [Caerostris darwini]